MKYVVLKFLKEAVPGCVTGAEMGERLGVSRTAIWKYIEELRLDGYTIEAASKKGYRLIPTEGLLNSFEIENNLGTQIVGREVLCYAVLPSTNTHAGAMASKGCSDGLAVVAFQQTQGKGRLGRSWESPQDKGIYLSVVLRPPMAPVETPIFTLAAAVAAVRAIYTVTGLKTGIKWPNDIVAEGKKICGILLEMNSEVDRVNHIVLGMGINYSQSAADFSEELQNRASSILMANSNLEDRTEAGMSKEALRDEKLSKVGGLKGGGDGRLELIRAVLRELDTLLRHILDGKHSKIIDMWREYSATLGKEVRFTLKDVEYTGIAVDITSDGRLVVDCNDGVRRELISGEVSVRGLYGYL